MAHALDTNPDTCRRANSIWIRIRVNVNLFESVKKKTWFPIQRGQLCVLFCTKFKEELTQVKFFEEFFLGTKCPHWCSCFSSWKSNKSKPNWLFSYNKIGYDPAQIWFWIGRRRQSRPPSPLFFWSAPRTRTLAKLWPLPTYAQSQWRSFIVTVDNHCCFKFLSVRWGAGRPWFAEFVPWKWPWVRVLGADQKTSGLWRRDWKRRMKYSAGDMRIWLRDQVFSSGRAHNKKLELHSKSGEDRCVEKDCLTVS